MFIVYRIAVEKSRQSRHSATAAGLLGCFAVVFEPYAGVKDVAQQVCVLHAGQAFKALGTLRQQQLKDLFHLFLIAGLLTECFQRIVGPLALVVLQIVIGIQQVDELAQMEADAAQLR